MSPNEAVRVKVCGYRGSRDALRWHFPHPQQWRRSPRPSQSETPLFKRGKKRWARPCPLSLVPRCPSAGVPGRDRPGGLGLCAVSAAPRALWVRGALQSGAGARTSRRSLQKVRLDSKFTGFLSSSLHLTFHFLLKVTTAFSFIYSFCIQLISCLKSSNGFGFFSVWGKRQATRLSFKIS